jgi:hypothetical protein
MQYSRASNITQYNHGAPHLAAAGCSSAYVHALTVTFVCAHAICGVSNTTDRCWITLTIT